MMNYHVYQTCAMLALHHLVLHAFRFDRKLRYYEFERNFSASARCWVSFNALKISYPSNCNDTIVLNVPLWYVPRSFDVCKDIILAY